MTAATMTVSEALSRIWDAVVVGSGPAGSVAALGLARRGHQVLLVDRSQFPRHKLCGACLNGDAMASLHDMGLADHLSGLNGVPLNSIHLHCGQAGAKLSLPSGIAVSRYRLDAMLVEAAIDAGAHFLPGSTVEVSAGQPHAPTRELKLTGAGAEATPLKAASVVLATGLAADRRIHDPRLGIVADDGARIGAGTTAQKFPETYSPGVIFMAVSRSGYVGLTRTEDGHLNIAAALDRDAVQQDSPRGVCEKTLTEAGFPVIPEMFSGEWRGSIGLTRRRQSFASERLFVAGDAAGYVEPFTGEGMAWAIRAGRAVVPYAENAMTAWNEKMIADWTRTAKRTIQSRQRLCRVLSTVLRYPPAVRGLIRVVAGMPALGNAVIRRLNKDNNHEVFDHRPGYSGPA